MANKISTVRTYPLNGAVDFTITFEYLARKFVQVTLIGKDRKELVLNQDYRFTTKTQITTSRAWTAADGYQMIEIRRFTSATDRLVDFADGSILRAYDLNISQIQTLHVAEEARDLTADTIGVNNDGHLDARGRRIVNVADGIAPGDAVTIGQMDRWTGSASNSADRAKVSETNAKASETKAKVSENNAKTSEINSKASETLAEKWASNPEDTLVSGTHYSALHYSRKAAESASSSSLSASAASISADDAATSASNAADSADEARTEADKLAQFNDIVDRMNSVAIAQVGSFEVHNSRTYAKPGTVYADGQISQRSLYPELVAELLAGHLPVVTDDVWLSTPSKRGCFSLGDGSTTFRFPDLNGVYNGSNSSAIYTDGMTEVRSNAIVIVWVVRTHGVVNNPGSVDAAVLASRVEQVYTELLTRTVANENRDKSGQKFLRRVFDYRTYGSRLGEKQTVTLPEDVLNKMLVIGARNSESSSVVNRCAPFIPIDTTSLMYLAVGNWRYILSFPSTNQINLYSASGEGVQAIDFIDLVCDYPQT